MKRPKHLIEIVISAGFLAYLLGNFACKTLHPSDILRMSREDSLLLWLTMVLRDVGLSVAVFTMITAGVKAIRFRGLHCRGLVLSCAGIGFSLVLLLGTIVGYRMQSKLFSGLFAEEKEARELVASWRAAGTLDEKQSQEWKHTFDSYDRMRPLARWSLGGLKRAVILWSALLVGGLVVGLILPIRDSERNPNNTLNRTN